MALKKNSIIRKYNLRNAHQVKQRIIWINLLQLVEYTFGNLPENKKKMSIYDHDFREAEREEK